MAGLGAALLPGFAPGLVPGFVPGPTGSPAALLHPSDRASLCCARQARIRPPPGCTPAHSFCASPAQAATSVCADADCAAVAAQITSNSVKLLITNPRFTMPIKNRVQHKLGARLVSVVVSGHDSRGYAKYCNLLIFQFTRSTDFTRITRRKDKKDNFPRFHRPQGLTTLRCPRQKSSRSLSAARGEQQLWDSASKRARVG